MPLTMPIDWDNPFWAIVMGIGHQDNEVRDFSASRYLVSNQEYLGFIGDGGSGRKPLRLHHQEPT